MTQKRQPIKIRIRKLVLAISIIAIFIISAIAVFFMFRMRFKSEDSLIEQMQDNAKILVDNKVEIANLQLEKYASYIRRTSKKIDVYQTFIEDFVPQKVLPPDPAKKGVYSIQRYYRNKDIDKNAVKDSMALLGNLAYYWAPMMEKDGDTITTIYVATENGYMLSFDKNADLAELDEDGESYFDYFDRPWYQDVKRTRNIVFTDCSQDYYGRGLTITCAGPIYRDGVFAGVVAMDILVTDLQKHLIDIDLGDGSYGFLVNKEGDIMASPYVTLEQEKFDNINDPGNDYYSIKDKILSKTSGVDIANDNVYCAHAPVTAAEWYLCIRIPEDLIIAPAKDIDEDIKTMMIFFLVWFLIICSAVFAVVTQFANKITGPIMTLTRDVELISGGDINRQATVVGNDEISDLAIEFNKMTAAIKNYIHDIKAVTAEKERIGAELNVATQIQKSMLPSTFPAFPDDKNFDIYASMTPAKEVGGDFYDFFKIDDTHLAVVVADVSGKGVPAALFMVIGKTLIKDHTTIGNNLGNVFMDVNNMLCEANSEGLFITAFEGVINLTTGKMHYVNAGHEMPYIYRKGKEFTALQMKAGFVLAGMEDMKYTAGEIQLEPGDKFFQYTDGVTEATDANNELYGMDRLKVALDKNADKKVSELLPAIKADIDEFVGKAPQFDDITMLGFEWTPIK